jgi:hypothetical protein
MFTALLEAGCPAFWWCDCAELALPTAPIVTLILKNPAVDRLASMRVRRAAAARDVRSAGTASPVPQYLSSGVWPRNAECGRTRLCSST